MQHLKLVHTAPPPAASEAGFTSRDLISLNEWSRRSDAHGYRRIIVEGGSTRGDPDEGAYVLLYTTDNDWARWGIGRSHDGIVIWHCGTWADLGTFDTMIEALESLPPAPVNAHARGRPLPKAITAQQLHLNAKPPVAVPRFFLVHSV
jgi:hypothetical protein